VYNVLILSRSNNNGLLPHFGSKNQLTVTPTLEASSSASSALAVVQHHRHSPIPAVGLAQHDASPPPVGYRQFLGSDMPGIVDN
jgi:hypothetical protein